MSAPVPSAVAGRVLVWVARVAWVGVGWLGGNAVSDALADRSSAVEAMVWGAAALWLGGAVALAVPAVVTLVVARVVVPLAVPAVAATAWHGVVAETWVAATACALVATVVLFTGEVGEAFAQASAYGHERRFPLRPPPGYLTAAVLAWVLAAAGLLVGPLLLAAGQWAVGAPVTLLVGVAVFAWPRWYQLGRRWLVLVPAGVVIHDHLVLAETVMLRRIDLAGVALAAVGTEAADLTGPAPGHALEIRTGESVTAILRGTPSDPRGTAIHLRACLVAPTRPGHALRALQPG